MRESIIWALSGIIDSPETQPIGSAITELREAAAMFYMANIQARAYDLPPFQNSEISLTVPEYPAYYLAKDLKKLGESEMNKTMFTRVTGVLFSYGEAYAVYNTRSALMKWNGMGEFKTLHSLIEIARLNAEHS